MWHLFMCMRIWMVVCVYILVCVWHVDAQNYGDQRLISYIFLSHYPPYLWERVTSEPEAWGFSYLGWPETPKSPPPSLGLGLWCYIWLFTSSWNPNSGPHASHVPNTFPCFSDTEPLPCVCRAPAWSSWSSFLSLWDTTAGYLVFSFLTNIFNVLTNIQNLPPWEDWTSVPCWTEMW